MMRRSKRAARRRIFTGAVVLAGLAAAVGGWRYWRPYDGSAKDTTEPVPGGAASRLPLFVDAADLYLAEATPAGDDGTAVLAGEGAAEGPAGPGRPGPVPLAMYEPDPEPGAGAAAGSEPAASDNPAIAAARQQQAAGRQLEARQSLNALLQQKLPRGEQAEVRRLLTALADETIFSRRLLTGDPLAEPYQVRSGDRLVLIGREYKIPAEGLMRVNGIKDATRLRADEKIKVLRGPFHARILQSDYRMDVYLQDLYVRSFRVGLGADQGTPEGVWRVKERLANPTYYPPASADQKRIIPPDDPQNPLWEYWIGLEGVSGDAAGRYGYGIHGTIEPDSIGKAVSLGCIRMHNEDVAFLFALLAPGESQVTVLP